MLARSRSPLPAAALPPPSTSSSIAVPWHARGIDEALERLATRLEGLTEAEVHDRLQSAGSNALTSVPPVSSMKIDPPAPGVVETIRAFDAAASARSCSREIRN